MIFAIIAAAAILMAAAAAAYSWHLRRLVIRLVDDLTRPIAGIEVRAKIAGHPDPILLMDSATLHYALRFGDGLGVHGADCTGPCEHWAVMVAPPAFYDFRPVWLSGAGPARSL